MPITVNAPLSNAYQTGLTCTATLTVVGSGTPIETVAPVTESATSNADYPVTFSNALPATKHVWRLFNAGTLLFWDKLNTDANGNEIDTAAAVRKGLPTEADGTPLEPIDIEALDEVSTDIGELIDGTAAATKTLMEAAGSTLQLTYAAAAAAAKPGDAMTIGTTTLSLIGTYVWTANGRRLTDEILGGGGSLYTMQKGVDDYNAISARFDGVIGAINGIEVGAPGAGADVLTWRLRHANNDPVADADAWITLTTNPAVQVVSSGRTDSDGVIVFLVSGYIANTATKRTFYGHAQKDGENPAVAVPLTCD